MDKREWHLTSVGDDLIKLVRLFAEDAEDAAEDPSMSSKNTQSEQWHPLAEMVRCRWCF